MDISVVIPVYNASSTIAICLRALFSQEKQALIHEVIVVDDGSSDDTVQTVQREFPHVMLIKKEQNTGVADARSRGVAVATGAYIAFVNADCEVMHNWSTVVEREMTQCDILAGSIRHRDTFAGRVVSISQFGEFSSDEAKYVTNMCANNCVIRKDLLSGISVPAALRRAGEDRFLAWQLVQKETKIYYCPEVEVFHHTPLTVTAIIQSTIYYAQYAVLARVYDPTLPGGSMLRVPLIVPVVFPAVRLLKDIQYLWHARKRVSIAVWLSPLYVLALCVLRCFYAIGCVMGVFFYLVRNQGKESSV